jgi:uracil-DNA glycosylase
VYPPVQDTFSALNWTPLDQVKVVIVGQDPYHGPNQAHGLCFSVRKGIRTPPSLRNIYKELKQDSAMDNFSSIPDHGYLERWAKQGVLMINTVMTVRQGEANSHKKKGWELVTDEIIRAVDRRAKQNRQQQQDGEGGAAGGGVVFLLWGKPATEKCQTALGVSLYNKNNDSSGVQSHRNIICTSHPSPLGATKTKSPFMGSHCFSRCNEALEAMGHTPIDWRVDGKL